MTVRFANRAFAPMVAGLSAPCLMSATARLPTRNSAQTSPEALWVAKPKARMRSIKVDSVYWRLDQ